MTVLIMIIFAANGAVSTHTQTFSSRRACEDNALFMTNIHKENNKVSVYKCTPFISE